MTSPKKFVQVVLKGKEVCIKIQLLGASPFEAMLVIHALNQTATRLMEVSLKHAGVGLSHTGSEIVAPNEKTFKNMEKRLDAARRRRKHKGS